MRLPHRRSSSLPSLISLAEGNKAQIFPIQFLSDVVLCFGKQSQPSLGRKSLERVSLLHSSMELHTVIYL